MKKSIASFLFALSFCLIGCGARSELGMDETPFADSTLIADASTEVADDAVEIQTTDAPPTRDVTTDVSDGVTDGIAPDAGGCGYEIAFVSEFAHPGIIVADPTVSRILADFVVIGGDDNLVVDQMTILSETFTEIMVVPATDGVSFVRVGITRGDRFTDRLVGFGTFLPGSNRAIVDFTEPVRVPAHGRMAFSIIAFIAPVVPNSATSGMVPGVARSGARVALGLATEGRDGLIRAHAEATGRPLNACLATVTSGPMFVVRRSKPTVTQLAIPFATIVPGDMDLYRFRVETDAAGSIALKRIRMSLVIQSVSGARVCNARLRRGSVELRWPQDYQIIGAGAQIDPAQCWDSAWWHLVILFTEEIVSGSGSAYTLTGQPQGFMVGDSLMTAFGYYTGPGDPGGLGGDIGVMTGYIRDLSGPGHPYDLALDLSPWSAPDSTMLASYPGFIWSDLSEEPHSPLTGIMGGSRDWTNGYLVEDLTRTQIFRR